MGSRESPEKGDAILQLSHSITEKKGKQGMSDPWALLPYCAPQKGSGTCTAVGFPPKAGFGPQPGQAHLAGVAFLVATPLGSLSFLGILHWRRKTEV